VPIVLKSGSLNLLEPSGPVTPCNGIALPLPLLAQWGIIQYETCSYLELKNICCALLKIFHLLLSSKIQSDVFCQVSSQSISQHHFHQYIFQLRSLSTPNLKRFRSSLYVYYMYNLHETLLYRERVYRSSKSIEANSKFWAPEG
jgi:hypothetical protein